AALTRGPQPRLHVAVLEALARARKDRNLQPLLLRGGSDCSRARGDPKAAKDPPVARRQADLGRATLRYRPLRELPLSAGGHRPQVLPAPVARGAEKALPEAARHTGEELEVLGFGRARTKVLERLHACIRGSHSRHCIAARALVRRAG